MSKNKHTENIKPDNNDTLATDVIHTLKIVILWILIVFTIIYAISVGALAFKIKSVNVNMPVTEYSRVDTKL